MLQEAMYKPLGLECGHKFCADCAFSCVGKGNALGTVRAILDHVREDAACPECRTKGVFVKAIELKATEKLIKQRCGIPEVCPPSLTTSNVVKSIESSFATGGQSIGCDMPQFFTSVA